MAGRTREELDRAFCHLDYELGAFLSNAAALAGPARYGEWQHAILESYLIHARLLAEFLGWMKQDPRDIKPADFGVSWERPTSEEASRIGDDVNAVSQWLSHLAWTRATTTDPKFWAYLDLVDRLLPYLDEFVSKLNKVHPEYALSLRARIDNYRRPHPST